MHEWRRLALLTKLKAFLEVLKGFRTTILLMAFGTPIVTGTTYMMFAGKVESGDLSGIILAVAALSAGSAFAYGSSKRATGRRAIDMAAAENMDNPPE